MTDKPEDPDDLAEDVRRLLLDLGVQARDLTAEPGEGKRAESDLAQIISGTPVQEHKMPGKRLVAVLVAASLLGVALVIARPFGGSDPARAERTPPVLRLQDEPGTVIDQRGTSATGELTRLAELAARSPARGAGPVQFVARSSWLLSTEESTKATSSKSRLIPTNSEQFFQPDGTVRSIERVGEALDPNGALVDRVSDWSKVRPTSDETFDGPDQGPDYPQTLSTNEEKLQTQLFDSKECTSSISYCFTSAAIFLEYNYTLDPALSASILRVLSTQADIRYVGRATDRLDRPSEAFVMPGSSASRRVVVLVDPTTGTFLGTEEILVENSRELGLTAPAVLEFTALVDSRRIRQADVPNDSSTTRY